MLEAPPRTRGMCERDSVLHGKAIDLLQGGGDIVLYTKYLFYFPTLSASQLHHTAESHLLPNERSRQLFPACGKHTLPKALSHVCVSESSGFTVWPLLL